MKAEIISTEIKPVEFQTDRIKNRQMYQALSAHNGWAIKRHDMAGDWHQRQMPPSRQSKEDLWKLHEEVGWGINRHYEKVLTQIKQQEAIDLKVVVDKFMATGFSADVIAGFAEPNIPNSESVWRHTEATALSGPEPSIDQMWEQHEANELLIDKNNKSLDAERHPAEYDFEDFPRDLEDITWPAIHMTEEEFLHEPRMKKQFVGRSGGAYRRPDKHTQHSKYSNKTPSKPMAEIGNHLHVDDFVDSVSIQDAEEVYVLGINKVLANVDGKTYVFMGDFVTEVDPATGQAVDYVSTAANLGKLLSGKNKRAYINDHDSDSGTNKFASKVARKLNTGKPFSSVKRLQQQNNYDPDKNVHAGIYKEAIAAENGNGHENGEDYQKLQVTPSRPLKEGHRPTIVITKRQGAFGGYDGNF